MRSMLVLRNQILINVFIALAIVISKVTGDKISICDVCSCESTRFLCHSPSTIDFSLFEKYDGSMIKYVEIIGDLDGTLNEISLSTFKNILELRLESNSIYIENSAFRSLLNLKHLQLRNNSIELLTTEMFEKNMKLEKIDLSENNIRKVEEGVFGRNLSRLIRLNISNNHITEIEERGFGPELLEELDLSSNQLRQLKDRTFEYLVRLRVLCLRDNLLEEVEEGAWSGLEAALEELDLSGNRLLRADAAAFAPLRALRVLRLERNRIASFGPALVEALAQRPGLSAQLQPNPLRCACGNGELRDAWEAASARGLRWSLVCADGRPWDAAMRDPSCSDGSGEAERDATTDSALVTEASSDPKFIHPTDTEVSPTSTAPAFILSVRYFEVGVMTENKPDLFIKDRAKFLAIICVFILSAICLVIAKVVYIIKKDARNTEYKEKKAWASLIASADEKKRLWSSAWTGANEYRDKV